jgi:hypothetical protein
VFLVLFVLTGWRIRRARGTALVLAYLAYIVVSLACATTRPRRLRPLTRGAEVFEAEAADDAAEPGREFR